MLTVVTAGLPISATNLITEAMNEAMGEGVTELVILEKSNLRSRIRLSKKNVSDILVIIDGVASDTCKDIENGLYSMDKYHTYTDDKSLAQFLNSKYGLNLVVEEVVVEEVTEVKTENSDSLIEEYENKIHYYEVVIRNLKKRISSLSELSDGVEFERQLKEKDLCIEKLRDENIVLKDKLLTSGEASTKHDGEIARLEKDIEDLRKKKEFLDSRLKSLSADYDSVYSELTDLRVLYSKQSSVILAKDSEIDKLKKIEVDFTELEETYLSLKVEVSNLRKEATTQSGVVSDLKVELDRKNKEKQDLLAEISRLQEGKEIGEELKKSLDKLRSDVSVKDDEIKSLRSDLNKSKSEVDSLQRELSEKESEVEKLKDSIISYENRRKEDDEVLSQLNKEKLELQGKLNALHTDSNRGGSYSGSSDEVIKLREELSELKKSVFGRISDLALPNGTVNVKIVKGITELKNIRFVFAGSTESRKGAYRCLLDEFRSNGTSERYLIVDLVSETCIDYVFEISKVTPGIDWFRKGGSIQSYLSKTVLRNVQVLSGGLGYLNDSYFLCIDWASRLRELENSGYKVIVFCGDISNIVGRVLHESFAGLGESTIFVHGNAVGSRSIITNLRGISNFKRSEVQYYDYNPSVQKFYDMIARTNRCKILSSQTRK